ncbi:hypothetical protein [Rugamonas sp.]|uniref:hypothetical protein n=1 Tax=Rugamonas sp. TaxID=1926287 RepID=UPI0025E06311|nr:hypothetical protein [Rugamonas sp.]
MDTIDADLTDTRQIAEELSARLQSQYGSVLGSTALTKELGYQSSASFQRALSRGTVPVPIFKIQHRRGSFALAIDVATWLSHQRAQAVGPRRSAT